jgi:hypothetical protein
VLTVPPYIDWNIVKTSNNITGNKTLLGLLVEVIPLRLIVIIK